MPSMEITTNIGCRVQCDFCPQELLIKEYSDKTELKDITYGSPSQMTLQTFKNCLEKIPENVLIGFAGYSEPFLNPDCSEMILFAHKKGHPISVFSTLVGMKLEDVEKIKSVPFTIFHIHLPDSSNFAKIAVNQNYLDVLKKIVSSKIKNVSGMSMGKLHPKVESILDTTISPLVMSSRAGTVDIVETIPKKIGPLSCNRSTSIDLIDRIDYNVLLPNGDVALCHNDYGLQNIIGNLVNSSYESLFHSKNYKEMFKKLKSNSDELICRYCEEAIPEKDLKEKQSLKVELEKNSNNNSNKIIELFQKHLGRFPEKWGFEYFYSQLTNGNQTLDELEKTIMESNEYEGRHAPKLKLKESMDNV